MLRIFLVCVFYSFLQSGSVSSQEENLSHTDKPSVQGVGVVMQPYTARRGSDEISIAPDILLPEDGSRFCHEDFKGGFGRIGTTKSEVMIDLQDML